MRAIGPTQCFAAALALLLAGGSPAEAQYFGRNKVQYKTFDFRVLQTEHFDIYYYPSEREGIDIAARLAERWRERLTRVLAHELSGRQPLVLYASHPDFEQTNTIGGDLGEGTGGVTEPVRRRIILPLAGPIGDTDHVIGHELVHAFQFDMTTSPDAAPGRNGAGQLPLWFIEGMAEYLSIGPVDPNTAMWLRDAARQDALPDIGDLDNPKYFPYRWGHAFWAYVAGRFGDNVIRLMLKTAADADDVEPAFERVLGMKSKALSADWKAAIKQTYAPVLEQTTPPAEIGRRVIEGTGLGGDLNVGPAISPDGRWIAFLSERSIFSTDLYIASAADGTIIRRLTRTASDPHYSSLQFIYSAGGWDATSRRLAIAAVVGGRPALAIFQTATGDKEREIPLPDLDEVYNPTWAPDGHAVAFTGMTRGLTDLYIYEFANARLRRLTNDAYADLMPAWSPDGRYIAFTTDRFTSNLTTLKTGPYRLAVLDVESGAIEQVRPFLDGKNINPQWAPDGRSLYFISDRDGISNLYRVARQGGEVAQLTRVGTGLSGITNTSPALSVASRSGTLCFSVYQHNKYDIYTLDAPGPAAASALSAASQHAAALPPVQRQRDEVPEMLGNPVIGLPPASQSFPSTAYRPTLSLEGVAQPSISAGTSRFGPAIGGGIGLQFSDQLSNHVVVAAAQFSSLSGDISSRNLAGQVGYFNQSRRWNWGVIGGQVPYLTAGFASSRSGPLGGDVIQTDQTIIYRQAERSLAGIVSYPFNKSQRVEFQGGVTHTLFDQVVQTTSYSVLTGRLLADSTQTLPLQPPLTLGSTSAALVFDNANYGATSPVQGQRYRLEAAPTFGSITYTSLLADYRRYVMPVRFYTLAARVLHYGRYGSASEDPRLFPMYLGYPNLVRGYDVNSFDPGDCVTSGASGCPAIDRLIGSRMIVGNLEFRFPLLRPFGVSQRMYGPLPVEVALFADGGVAWNAGQKPSFFGGQRDGVSSAGVTVRVSFFGAAVGEFDVVRPFQRPGRGWMFQFNLAPGF